MPKTPRGILKQAAKWGLVPAAAAGGYYANDVTKPPREIVTIVNHDVAYTIEDIDGPCEMRLGRPLEGWVDCEQVKGWIVADVAHQGGRE